MNRILLLLRAAEYEDVREALENAASAADQPSRLSFGLLLEEEPGQESWYHLFALGHTSCVLGTDSLWDRVEEMWSGEEDVLLGHPAMRFERGWDTALERILNWCQHQGNYHCALTGYLPRREDAVDAVSPVATGGFDILGRLRYERGTPLRYARKPQRSAFVHRDFCFAPAAFFRQMAEMKAVAASSGLPLFLRAYETRWQLYTLHRPVIRLLWDDALPPEDVRSIRPEEVQVFETRFGVHFGEKAVDARARCGIFEPGLTFETRVPLDVRLQEGVRSAKLRHQEATPLCVTAWLTLPGVTLEERRMLAFRRLSSLRGLALLCFADPKNAPRITLSHPNVLEFKRRYGLNAPDECIQEDYANYVKLCKPFLLSQAREKFMLHSHYVWMDFDYLRCPVYEGAGIDWRTLCTDRIAIGMVGDELDTGMMVLPQGRIEPLCREIEALWEMNRLAGKGLMQEKEMYLRLMHDHPDWFLCIPLNAPGELFFRTMLPRGKERHTRT